jgi:2,3-dihydroxybenzoate-AMP ligase
MLEGCTPWPAGIARRYRQQGYWRGQDLSGLLRDWAHAYGSRTALVEAGRRIGYAELDRRVDRMAAGFRKHGINPGDRVVVQLPNLPEFVIVCFALFRLDAKPVFSLLAHRLNEIRHLCAVSQATGYVVPGMYQGSDFTALAAQAMAESPALQVTFVMDGTCPSLVGDGADADRATAGAGRFIALGEVDADPGPLPVLDASDVAFFLLSGGTTALPKLIPRTHDDYIYQAKAAAELIDLSPSDVYLAALPVEFNFAWGCPGVIGTLCSGGTVVFAEDGAPAECFETIQRERVSFTSLVPTVAQLWLDAVEDVSFDHSSLRLIQIGGAPLHAEIAAQIEPAFDCVLQQVFGMAEGLLSMTRTNDPLPTRLTTQGRPLSPVDELRIVDEDGVDLPPGAVGELLARGPYTLWGYYQSPEHNVLAFTEDGFYRSGDLARVTQNGDLVIVGRLKDVIIRGGHKISAAEIEGHLLTHPAVDRVAVVAVPDHYLGERICAYVRPADGAQPTLLALRDALHARGLADYKLPDRLELVADLKLTGLGKVDKKFLEQEALRTARTRAVACQVAVTTTHVQGRSRS